MSRRHDAMVVGLTVVAGAICYAMGSGWVRFGAPDAPAGIQQATASPRQFAPPEFDGQGAAPMSTPEVTRDTLVRPATAQLPAMLSAAGVAYQENTTPADGSTEQKEQLPTPVIDKFVPLATVNGKPEFAKSGAHGFLVGTEKIRVSGHIPLPPDPEKLIDHGLKLYRDQSPINANLVEVTLLTNRSANNERSHAGDSLSPPIERGGPAHHGVWHAKRLADQHD
jgi:hypothetical protein